MAAPAELPRTWLAPQEIIAVTRDAIQSFTLHRTNRMAAALAFFTFFSLFPALLLLLALLGYLLDMEQIQGSALVIQARSNLTEIVKTNLPGTDDLVGSVIGNVQAARGASGLIGVLGLLWSASNAFNHMHIALDQIWGISGVPGFWLTLRRRGMSIFFVLSLGLLLILSQVLKTGTVWLVSLSEQFAFVPDVAPVYTLVTSFFPFLVAIFAFGAAYRSFPSISVSWYEVWPGAVLAGIAWELLKWLFAQYAIEFANWQAVYGPIASVIALLTLLYLTFTVVFFGAEFSAAYSRQLALRGIAELGGMEKTEDQAALDVASGNLEPLETKRRRVRPSFTAGTLAGVIGAVAAAGIGAGLLARRVRRFGQVVDEQNKGSTGDEA